MEISPNNIATRDETIEAVLAASKRRSQRVPIDRRIAQLRVPAPERVAPGPLAEIVKRGRDTALEQYLLLAAWASAPDEDGLYGVRRPSALWARLIGLQPDARGKQQVSRNWGLLQELHLVQTKTVRRQVRATRLLEDGSGSPYVPPSTAYLGLPFAYWREGWHTTLDLPAKAMLLILLTLPPRSPLPFGRAPEWYGISKATADRGVRTLRRQGLLQAVHEPHKEPLAPDGYTKRNVYTLTGAFATKATAKAES